MKLALMGVSVLFASGDQGVANTDNQHKGVYLCLNAENGYLEENGTSFAPSFPENCPYVLMEFRSS
jgi:tripeptidyl-peptidase I